MNAPNFIRRQVERRETGWQMLHGMAGRMRESDVEKNVRVPAGICSLFLAEIDHNDVLLPARVNKRDHKPPHHGMLFPAATTAQMRSNVSPAVRSPSTNDLRKVA